MTSKQFADLLVRHGVVDAEAIDDAEGYDSGETLNRVRAAHAELWPDNTRGPLGLPANHPCRDAKNARGTY